MRGGDAKYAETVSFYMIILSKCLAFKGVQLLENMTEPPYNQLCRCIFTAHQPTTYFPGSHSMIECSRMF